MDINKIDEAYVEYSKYTSARTEREQLAKQALDEVRHFAGSMKREERLRWTGSVACKLMVQYIKEYDEVGEYSLGKNIV